MRKSNGIVKTLMINRIPLVNKILKKIWIALAILIILAAVSSSIFRSLTPWATQYKGEVEEHLTSLLGQPVTIQSMETGWYWFQPVLKLKQITINDGKKQSLHLEKLLVGINLFKSLWHWSIQPGVLYIDDINLTFRQKEGRWRIDGISADAVDGSEMNPEKAQQMLVWLSQQERLIIKQVNAHFHFSDGGLIPVSGLNVSIVNSGGYYKLKGEAKLDQTNSTFFQLLGTVQFDPNHFEETKGQIYFSAKHVAPAQWQSLFPATNQRLEGGKGNIDLWVDLDKGAISLIQAQVNLKRLAWRLLNTKKSELIQSFAANMSWKPNGKGWQFNADHIKLRAAGVNWPENQLLVQFDKKQNSYQLFVKSILIESLLSEAVNWPKEIQNILQIKPHGALSDAQVLIKENTVQYILTRFDHLGWDAKDTLPQVDNLSGVLHWQPEEGRLELDSENTTINIKGYPVQNLALLNGSADWKQLAEGLRVSIDRFVLSKPDLTISAQGAMDQVSSQSIGSIRLNADFAAKDVQQWMAYLPKDKMKAKLYAWLNNDVKRIADASGKITINGLAKDFPFDNNNGEFSIISHASGGEILITPKWQLVKDLEGYVRLKNRNLEIDLVNGDFQGVPVKQMNLRIDDIGKDKETLLIHGIVQGQAQKMMNFVMASPLQQKLSALKMLTMKGLLSLDLHLEIPLYPENDDDLARGDLTFAKNTVLVTHKVGSVSLEDISGNLSFDEKGVTHSAITATALGYPVNINIQSVKEPQPLTTLSIDAECSVDSLKSRFNLPLFQVMKGVFSVQALFKLTDDPNDLDNVLIKSSLEGLAINLPAPFGKSFNTKAPLDVSLDFNLKKAIRIRSRFNERVSSDLLFEESKGDFDFHSGQIRLGSNTAVNQKIPGLEIVGTLEQFDLQEWKKVFAQFAGQSSNFILLNKLRIIDLKLNKLNLLKQNFDQMKVQAKILPDNSWAFNVNQKNIAGDLTYYPSTNALNGFIKQLHLTAPDTNSLTDEDSSSAVTPDQIPNLNLRVDNLSVGTRQIGNLTLKSQSNAQRWLIDYCRIDSPIYQFNINGEWTHKDKDDNTKMQVKLHLKDLAKTLELWQITPAVDAGKGDMQFNGGWNGALYDFSLKALNGTMYLQLKSGRITHLSPETEEKLGLGKLLSILSLQTIPRRLKLDFSDLSHDGYSFDIFKGNFSVKRGIMSTQDSYIDGPVAYAGMKGNLDLVRHMYDLDLKISPHITASLPVVATIAGGPLAGIAAWVANKIINQSMQKITAYSYKISGPWNQPVVQQLSMVKKIIKKR